MGIHNLALVLQSDSHIKIVCCLNSCTIKGNRECPLALQKLTNLFQRNCSTNFHKRRNLVSAVASHLSNTKLFLRLVVALFGIKL